MEPRLVDLRKPLVTVADLGKEPPHGTVIVRGWIFQIRPLKANIFLSLRDGAGSANSIQVVTPGIPDFVQEQTYVEICGTLEPLPPKARSFHPYEIHTTAENIKCIGMALPGFNTTYPETANRSLQLDHRHQYLRHKQLALTAVLHAQLLKSLRLAFEDMRCTEISPPLIVGNQCEGGATLFDLKYPNLYGEDSKAYLTQSSQFYLEYMVPVVGDCFCIADSFRKEKFRTRRHLTTYVHAEAEWRDVYTMSDHLHKLTDLLVYTLEHFRNLSQVTLEDYKPGLALRLGKLINMVKTAQIMTHREAIQYCRDHKIYKEDPTPENPDGVHFGDRDDIPEKQERAMIDQLGKVVFLTKFPKEFKSFYMCPDPQDPSLVLGCDVEVPGVGEIIGSGVRVYDHGALLAALKEQGLKPEEYAEYLDLRQYGHARTSGMGLGVGRLLTWLLEEYSILDVTQFPRVPGLVTP